MLQLLSPGSLQGQRHASARPGQAINLHGLGFFGRISLSDVAEFFGRRGVGVGRRAVRPGQLGQQPLDP